MNVPKEPLIHPEITEIVEEQREGSSSTKPNLEKETVLEQRMNNIETLTENMEKELLRWTNNIYILFPINHKHTVTSYISADFSGSSLSRREI